MASDENMTFQSSLQDQEFDDHIVNDGYDHNNHHQHPHNLSRLSVCTSSTLCGVDGDKNHDNVDNAMTKYVSRLSIENLEVEEEGDADGEFSDGSESENELGSSSSLPAMPSRGRSHGRLKTQKLTPVKDYASDYEAQKSVSKGEKMKKEDSRRTRKSRRNKTKKWVFDGANYNWKKNGDENKTESDNLNEDRCGESDESGGGNERVRVITKPKGGRRTLCMDLEEVKACRDLGFELEHEVMLEMPCSSRLSVDTTSSDGNSPISNWPISTPGISFSTPHYHHSATQSHSAGTVTEYWVLMRKVGDYELTAFWKCLLPYFI